MSLNRIIAGLLAAAAAAGPVVGASKPKPETATTQKPVSTNAVALAHTNRLAREKSPYLLQHAHNPVDWYPWGEAAFEKARKENKPVFLSIGYATCHWCHVMERESFEDQSVAAVLNEHFVSIKVDREERPDVDKIYMTAVQAMGQGGGWPLNAFLTPDRKPFYGGTYFPPDNRYGRPSFVQVLQQISQLWRERHGEIVRSATELHQRLAELTDRQGTNRLLLTSNALHQAASLFKNEFDPRHGGFGSAPKFPQPSQPAFLLRHGVRCKDQEAVRMVAQTCERMASGGIHDQLGGGFARYSVDAQWLVPHFEKMLYDNAQLLGLYLDAYRVGGEERFAEVARGIIRYVLRDMTHPDGGFYSAEDADSEGHEGKFYCWTRAELESLLSKDEFELAVRYFGISDKGNFTDHSHPSPLPGQNVLSLVAPKISDKQKSVLESARKKMFEARSRRMRPLRDDKVLASWNGLMLGAVARAYGVLGDEAYRAAAEKNLAFIQAKLWVPSGRDGFPAVPNSKKKDGDAVERVPPSTLFHRWREGERDTVQLLNGYAFLLEGVVQLYEVTLEPKHLDFAIALAEAMIERFYDPEHGGFWQSTPGAADLILRVKEDYDGAEPSGNSVATLALLKLAAITDRKDFKQKAEATLRLFSDRLQQMPHGTAYLLQALGFWLEEPKRVVIAGDPAAPATRALLRAVHSIYQPNKVVLGNSGAVEPFAKTLPAKDGKPTVYLCVGTACLPPTSEAAKMKELLR